MNAKSDKEALFLRKLIYASTRLISVYGVTAGNVIIGAV